jgi:hypothetical protein
MHRSVIHSTISPLTGHKKHRSFVEIQLGNTAAHTRGETLDDEHAFEKTSSSLPRKESAL